MALCLGVKECEFIYIGDDIRISARKHKGKELRIWVEAPMHLKVERDKSGERFERWAKKASKPKS